MFTHLLTEPRHSDTYFSMEPPPIPVTVNCPPPLTNSTPRSSLVVASIILFSTAPIVGAQTTLDASFAPSIGSIFDNYPIYKQVNERTIYDITTPQHFVPQLDYDIRLRAFNYGELIEPIFASYHFSSDKTTYEFKIREEARWSDGSPVTSEDFRFTLEDVTWFSPDVDESSVSTVPRGYIAVHDEHTFSMIFEKPYVLNVDKLGANDVMLYPAHFLKRFHPWYNAEIGRTQADFGILLDHARYNPERPVIFPLDSDVTQTGEIEWKINSHFLGAKQKWQQFVDSNSANLVDQFDSVSPQDPRLLYILGRLPVVRDELRERIELTSDTETGEHETLRNLSGLQQLFEYWWISRDPVTEAVWRYCWRVTNSIVTSWNAASAGDPFAMPTEVSEDTKGVLTASACVAAWLGLSNDFARIPAFQEIDPNSCSTCVVVGGFNPNGLPAGRSGTGRRSSSRGSTMPTTSASQNNVGERNDEKSEATSHGDGAIDVQLIADSTVIVLVTKSEETDRSLCTGTHLGGGLVLTAGHCIYDTEAESPDEAGSPYHAWHILFGCTDSLLQRDGKSCVEVPAEPVVRLLQHLKSKLRFGDDVGVLRTKYIPEYYGKRFLSFDGSALTPDRSVIAAVAFEVPGYDRFRGKALIDDAECRIIERGCKSRKIIKDVMKHGCDTQPGSSGSPILAPGGGILGMHLAGHQKSKLEDGLLTGDANCLMPARTVVRILSTTLDESDQNRLTFVNWREQ